MFSLAQKQHIASELEKLLLSFNHPEMPKVQPMFRLMVYGETPISWADIRPNWTFNDANPPGINPHNEAQDPAPKQSGSENDLHL